MSKLTIDECKRIISNGRRQLTEAQKRIAKLEAENAELWELVRDMAMPCKLSMCNMSPWGKSEWLDIERRIKSLGTREVE